MGLATSICCLKSGEQSIAILKSFFSIRIEVLRRLSFTFEDINRVTLDVLLKDYLFLLNVDPCVSDTHLDWEIVIVEPHQYTTPKVVSPDLYQILNAINQFYLNNRVSLIRLLQVS